MNQVRIKRDFGDVIIEYTDLEDLERKLDEVKKVEELVTSRVAPTSLHAQRQPKPGYEDIYRFLPDGTVELLVFPKKKVHQVALVLFAYGQRIPSSLIEKCTNIRNVASNVLTTGGNKKYFNRTKDGKYSLSSEALELVTSVVVPRLQGKKATN